MKSKISYFSISMPLVKENLRRFWAIPVIGFLAYFLSSVFPILMSYNNINNMYSYIEMCLTNKQPIFMCVHLFVPIITAVIIFRFMQNPGSVTTIHSMPFTRAQLFNSSLLSGLILILLPLVVNEIMLQAIAKPSYDIYMYVDYEKMSVLSDNAVNIFTRSNVLHWFWQSLLIVLFIYAISILAGMVTGHTVMHLSLAFGFNFLAPALYLTFIIHCSNYLFGFTHTGIHENIFFGLSPFTQIFESDGKFTTTLQIYYITFTIFTLIISAFLYQKRQMEKSGNSIVFNFMIPFISYLIAYFGMSLMGYYFTTLSSNNNSAEPSDTYFYAGLAAGAVISFIIGRMIVLKTPRVFNTQSLKSFALFSLIAILFICSITLDLMGFEKRVPSSNKVRGVLSTNFNFAINENRYDIELFKVSKSSKDGYFYYTDSKNIEALIALHQDIIKNQNEIEKEKVLNVETYPISLYYTISNPLGMQREYILTHNMIKNNKYLKQLYESLEFKSNFSFDNLNYKKLSKITLNNQYFSDEIHASNLVINDAKKVKSLLKAMDQDFKNRTYEKFVINIHPYCKLYLEYQYLDNGKITKNNLDACVLLSDDNTIKWLQSYGYSQYLECNSDMIEKIVFFEQNVDNDKKDSIETSGEQTRKQLVITDKKQIQEVLDTYSSIQTNYDKYYEGYIVYKQANEFTETYPDIYYDFDTAPSFISNYFN